MEPKQQSELAPHRDAAFRSYPDDEISLIDLAKILIKRRWWLFGVFGFFVISAFSFALINRGEPEFNFSSIYQVAEVEPGEVLHSPESLIQEINNLHAPEYIRNYLAENSDLNRFPFELSVSNPSGTPLIILRTGAVEADREEVNAFHRFLLEKVSSRQSSIIDQRVQRLERQISQIDNTIAELQDIQGEAAVELIASNSSRRFELDDAKQAFQQPSVLQYAAQGDEVSGRLGGSLILALGIVLGGILGIMAAFFVEFAARVRQSIKEDA